MKDKFFKLCKKLLPHSEHPQHKHAAVISYKSDVISVGFNKMKTSPRVYHKWGRIHAEAAAILAARTDLSGCDIYVYREKKDGTPAMSRPCPSCWLLLREVGIKRVYYSIDNDFRSEDVA